MDAEQVAAIAKEVLQLQNATKGKVLLKAGMAAMSLLTAMAAGYEAYVGYKNLGR